MERFTPAPVWPCSGMKQYRVTLQAEVSHLLVHGILHALGYDHEDPVDEKKMRAREERILGRAHHH